MKAFVQYKYDIPYNSAMYDALLGFEDLGYEVVPYTFEEMLSGSLDIQTDTPVVGTVASVHAALRQLGKPIPENFDIPKQLMDLRYLQRCIWRDTLGEVRKEYIDGCTIPMHIKPAKRQKLFTGHVIREYKDLLLTTDFEDDVELLCSDFIRFESEWRVFILHKSCLDCRPYLGYPTECPSVAKVNEMIRMWSDAPVAYSLDVGMVMSKSGLTQHTVLIEANDSYALGTYGMEPIKYARMIEARWKELMQ